jgi:hypothetical protein
MRFTRTAALTAIQTQVWRHEDDAVPARPLTLTVPHAPLGDVVIEIDEGDNQPLPIERATLLVPSYAVRFYRADAAPLLLAYGRPNLANPRYDLALLAPYVLGQRAHTVQAGPERGANGDAPGSGAQPSLVSPMVFWAVLGVAVVVLLGLVVRMVRREV